MTKMDTEMLIDQLAREAAPVKRLLPPMLRASLCIAAILGVIAAAILLFADMSVVDARAQAPYFVVECVGTIATGILATIAAFHLSLPDRSPRWALLPIPGLGVWLSGSGLGCLGHFLSGGGDELQMRASMHCVMFIGGIGIPLMIVMLWVLGRARPLSPAPVAVTGGLAAAAFAAFLLQFFHPFEISLMDLMMHAAAVAVVVWLSSTSGERMLAR